MISVSKRFGATRALDGVDLDVMPGEVHALIGENGAGKSTLMKVLAGEHQPDAGGMELDGEPYRPRSPADGRASGVVMVYQELSLAPHLTVAENILLGSEPGFGPLVSRRALRRQASDALRQLARTDIPIDAPVQRLPLAQRQLIEVARGIASGCRVLVLDEPTSSLSRDDVERLFALIHHLRRDGQSILYISHVLEEVREIGDRYTVLRDGRRVGGGDIADASPHDMIAQMVGRDIGELYPRATRTPGEPLLEVDRLAGVPAPRDASLAVRRGEIVGIAGLLGAGRTELLRALFGLAPIRSGSVRVGAYVGPCSPARRWAQGVGLVCEDRAREGLALNRSVAENLTLPALTRHGALGLVWPARQSRAARRWIDALPIRCRSHRQPVGELSGGNQQKVALARLLHADCDLLLLDEPTRGIDVASRAEMYQRIDDLVRGRPVASSASDPRPRAAIIVSSYLPELLGVCDRIAVMRRGRLGPLRPVAELDERRLLAEAIGPGSEA